MKRIMSLLVNDEEIEESGDVAGNIEPKNLYQSERTLTKPGRCSMNSQTYDVEREESME